MSELTTQTTGFPWLTAVVFLPLAGAVMLFFVKESLVRWAALVVALADLGLSLPLWLLFDPSTPRMQFTERVSWIADRKSTRLNSSHSQISYAVFCLKKK